jgi:hypothetical protein
MGRVSAKGLRSRNSPTCTLSQNGYGDDTLDSFPTPKAHFCSDSTIERNLRRVGLMTRRVGRITGAPDTHISAGPSFLFEDRRMTTVGFEPTPLRTGALSQRLRPLGQIVLMAHEIVVPLFGLQPIHIHVWGRVRGWVLVVAVAVAVAVEGLLICPTQLWDVVACLGVTLQRGGINAGTRDRTGDLQIFSLTLSQLSYRGTDVRS